LENGHVGSRKIAREVGPEPRERGGTGKIQI
jgi:hypothetical protein